MAGLIVFKAKENTLPKALQVSYKVGPRPVHTDHTTAHSVPAQVLRDVLPALYFQGQVWPGAQGS